MTINLNTIAAEITRREGGAQALSVAQVKEVLALTLAWLATLEPVAILQLIRRYEGRWKV